MSEFVIRMATRTGVKPLVGFYGKSGSGKTMSALLFARGIAGPSGRITMIDTENGRGSIFADIIPGGYQVLELDAPFSPSRYEAAIVAAEAQSEVLVVDSLSHEWSGEGGVLEMAEAELERMGGGDNNKMRSWIKPKMSHKQMVMRLLRCKCALICCLRGEEKTHMGKGQSGRTTVITDDFSSPLFDPRFIFELLLNFETVAHEGKGGFVVPRKVTHPDIGRLLPGDNEQIGVKHGEALAAWCASPGLSHAPQGTGTGIGHVDAGAVAKAAAPSAGKRAANPEIRARMLELFKDIHVKMLAWSIDKGILMPNQSLEEFPLSRTPTTKAELEALRAEIEAHV